MTSQMRYTTNISSIINWEIRKEVRQQAHGVKLCKKNKKAKADCDFKLLQYIAVNILYLFQSAVPCMNQIVLAQNIKCMYNIVFETLWNRDFKRNRNYGLDQGFLTRGLTHELKQVFKCLFYGQFYSNLGLLK